MYCLFFFFQAEDGIRDYKVTGVQTCALPICHAVEHAEGCSLANLVEVRSIQKDFHGRMTSCSSYSTESRGAAETIHSEDAPCFAACQSLRPKPRPRHARRAGQRPQACPWR